MNQPPEASDPIWYRLTSDEAVAQLGADPQRGLSAQQAVERLRELLPEAADLPVDRYDLPNLRSLNFVVHGLLQEGVAASTRLDAQAKSLGEWLRARHADVPAALL